MPIAGTDQFDVYKDATIFNGAGNLSFCEGATLTLAQAMAAGWKDFGHVISTDITPSVTTTSHKACRLGAISSDKEFVSDSSLKLGIKCEEWRKFILAMGLAGDSATDLTQAIHTSAAAATMAFTKSATSGDGETWYNILKSGTTTPVRLLSAASYAVPAENVTFSTPTFTASGHLGWKNGTRVLLGGSAVPTGFTAQDYFVVNYAVGATNDTFSLALTVGGAAVTGSDAGTSVTVTQQFDEGEQVITDGKNGRVRFLYPVSQTVTPTVTAPAIDANNNPEYMFEAVTPMATLTRSGWFELKIYADGSDTTVVGTWIFFGSLISKGASGLDGSKAAQFDFEITVGATKGTFYSAPTTVYT